MVLKEMVLDISSRIIQIVNLCAKNGQISEYIELENFANS